MELPKRRPNRLKSYDYSAPGAYFITICTEERKNYFWRVGASSARPPEERLTALGIFAQKAIFQMGEIYPAVTVERAVVMPNHLHLLLQIHTDANGRPMVAPTVAQMIQQLKGVIAKQAGRTIWQKSFHDHVIRCQADFDEIARYIEENPLHWEKDCFYKNNKSHPFGWLFAWFLFISAAAPTAAGRWKCR